MTSIAFNVQNAKWINQKLTMPSKLPLEMINCLKDDNL